MPTEPRRPSSPSPSGTGSSGTGSSGTGSSGTAIRDAGSERRLAILVYTLSALVIGLVTLLMLRPQLLQIEGLDVSRLPGFHALLNGTTGLLLLLGVLRIRKGKIEAHRRCMTAAFSLSSLFLVSYLIYHSTAPSSSYGGEGPIRAVYFFILITHIILAAGILPLALFTISRAFRHEFEKHRRIARITFPLWFYVTITGVAVYWMMRPYYAFG